MAVEQITATAQYLTFKLDEDDYAVDVANVRNILEQTSITKIPRTPEFMRGVTNDRGNVLPVVDLRLKFGMPEIEKTIDTCIIVMEVSVDDEVIHIGGIADSVNEVIDLESANIEPAPKIGTRLAAEFISGIGKWKEQFIIILDIAKVFSDEEWTQVKEASHAMVSEDDEKEA